MFSVNKMSYHFYDWTLMHRNLCYEVITLNFGYRQWRGVYDLNEAWNPVGNQAVVSEIRIFWDRVAIFKSSSSVVISPKSSNQQLPLIYSDGNELNELCLLYWCCEGNKNVVFWCCKWLKVVTCVVSCVLTILPPHPGDKCKINFSGRGQNGEKDFGSTRVEKEEQFLQ